MQERNRRKQSWQYAFFRINPNKSRKTSVRSVCKPLVGWLPMEYRSNVWLFALTSSVDLLKISCISTEHNEKKHVYRKCCLVSFKPFTWRCGSDYNKLLRVQAKEPYWDNMGIASLILYFGIRWIWEVEFTSPPLWLRKRTPVSSEKEPAWTFWKEIHFFSPLGTWTPDQPARLYIDNARIA
jgi:hypothetical protein